MRYEFEVEDIIYWGEGKVRIKARIKDEELREKVEEGGIGTRLEGGEWKIEWRGRGKGKLIIEKHGCGKENYRIMGKKGKKKIVGCLKCGWIWETEASYVGELREATYEEGVEIVEKLDYYGRIKVVME